jgi:hypothetical protein
MTLVRGGLWRSVIAGQKRARLTADTAPSDNEMRMRRIRPMHLIVAGLICFSIVLSMICYLFVGSTFLENDRTVSDWYEYPVSLSAAVFGPPLLLIGIVWAIVRRVRHSRADA